MELLALSVGIGLAISLLSTELFGVASAGLIVPGYIALNVTNPKHLAATLLVALVSYTLVRVASSFIIIFGRRRTVLMILCGYVIGMLVRRWSGIWGTDFSTIGFIIPGLIAVWMDRQGVVHTVASLAIVASIVRLLLILFVGAELAR